MDSSGRIYTPDEMAAMSAKDQRARRMVEIPNSDLARVVAMNEAERLAYHAWRAPSSLARVEAARTEADARRIFDAIKKRERKAADRLAAVAS